MCRQKADSLMNMDSPHVANSTFDVPLLYIGLYSGRKYMFIIFH